MKRITIKIAKALGIGRKAEKALSSSERERLVMSRAAEKALTGGYTKADMTTKEKAAELVAATGSTKAAAEAAGVSHRTMQKWVKGTQEAKNTARARNADNLDQAHRAARVKDSRADRLAKAATGTARARQAPTGGNPLRIKATVTVSADTRERWLDLGPYLSPGTLDNLAGAYVEGGPDAAGDILRDAIREYVTGMHIDSIDAIQI